MAKRAFSRRLAERKLDAIQKAAAKGASPKQIASQLKQLKSQARGGAMGPFTWTDCPTGRTRMIGKGPVSGM